MHVDRLTALSAIGAAVLAPQVASADTVRGPSMRHPLSVTIDYEPTYPAVYVYYVPEEDVHGATPTRIGDTLVVDTNDKGELVGLELLDMSAGTLGAARALAVEYNAAFPTFLRAV
jgi:hypothetical protein